MTSPKLHHLQTIAHDNLEIANIILQAIQDFFPHATNLPHHRRLSELLRRVSHLLDHPILLIFHTIVYLRRAARYSHTWATLLKNIPTLENHLLKTSSSSSKSVSVSESESKSKSESESESKSKSESESESESPPSPNTTTNQSPTSKRKSHTLQTRLRLRAISLALQHEKSQIRKLPASVTPPDIEPIPQDLDSKSSSSSSSSSSSPSSSFSSSSSKSKLLSESGRKPPLSGFQLPNLFPSETLWASAVNHLQLRVLDNLIRALSNIQKAALQKPPTLSSSIPPMIPTLENHLLKTSSSSSSIPSISSILSIPPPSAFSNPKLKPQTTSSHPSRPPTTAPCDQIPNKKIRGHPK